MAEKFGGKWILKESNNCGELWKALGSETSFNLCRRCLYFLYALGFDEQGQLENSTFDKPENNIEMRIEVSGKRLKTKVFMNGKHVFGEEHELGAVTTLNTESFTGKVRKVYSYICTLLCTLLWKYMCILPQCTRTAMHTYISGYSTFFVLV